MTNNFFFMNIINLSTNLSIQALDYYIQIPSESNETKKICANFKNYFVLLKSSLISTKYKNLTEIYQHHSFINSINIKLFLKNKKTKTIIYTSEKFIHENLSSQNVEDLSFISRNMKNFLEKTSNKFYSQKTQSKFLSATTKEKECSFKMLLHSDINSPICYIYNPFFTLEICSSSVKIIVNYTYCSSSLFVEFKFIEPQQL